MTLEREQKQAEFRGESLLRRKKTNLVSFLFIKHLAWGQAPVCTSSNC